MMEKRGMTLLACLLAALMAAACGEGRDFVKAAGAEGVQRFAVSVRGDDVGYMELRVEELAPDCLAVSQEIDWNMILMGSRRDVSMSMYALCDSTYDLSSMTMSLSDGSAEMALSAERRGDVLVTSIGTAGRTIETETEVGDDYLPVLADLACAAMDWEEGQERTFRSFDPASGAVLQVGAVCEGFEQADLLGDTITAAKLVISQLGTENIVWVHEGEIVREEESGLGMSMTRVPPGQQGEVVATMDLYDVFAVSTTPISDPRRTGRRRFVLQGDLDWEVLDLHNPPVQTAAGCTVTVSTGPPLDPAPFPPDVPDSLSAYLLSGRMVQSDDPQVAALADSLTAGSSDSWEAALDVCGWVDAAVMDNPTVSLPSAVDVLENLRGDCNEHTVLAVALARAAGLPARTCAGIVYLDGRFGYHAWPMIWVGEWVQMDPTFGQQVADATHIILAVGDLDAQYVINSVIGRLSLVELPAP